MTLESGWLAIPAGTTLTDCPLYPDGLLIGASGSYLRELFAGRPDESLADFAGNLSNAM
jgi:hypothetical protein